MAPSSESPGRGRGRGRGRPRKSGGGTTRQSNPAASPVAVKTEDEGPTSSQAAASQEQEHESAIPVPLDDAIPTAGVSISHTDPKTSSTVEGGMGAVDPSTSGGPQSRPLGTATVDAASTSSQRGISSRVRPRAGAQRRSKEDREAAERAEKEREKARTAATASPTRGKEDFRARRGANERGRGGESTSTRGARGGPVGAASGPFSSGVHDKSSMTKRGRGGRSGGSSSNTGARHDGTSARRGGSGGGGGGSRGGPSLPTTDNDRDGIISLHVKHEGEGYDIGTPSTPESVGIDVDHMDVINLVSDNEEDDDDDDPVMTGRRDRPTPKKRARDIGIGPVRVSRVEHVDRIVGINTDASAFGASALRKKEMTTDGSSSAVARSKGKGKAKANGHAVGESKVKIEGPRGSRSVQLEDDDDDDDDVVMVDESLHDAPSKVKSRSHTRVIDLDRSSQPHLMEDEWDEYQRSQGDQETLYRELGDMNGIIPPDDTTRISKNVDYGKTRNEKVYLFQFPPTMPSLSAPITDESHISSPIIKREGVTGVGTSLQTAIPLDPSGTPSTTTQTDLQTTFPPQGGRIGKLRIYASGRATLDWGGVPFTVSMGTEPSFLQSAVSTNLKYEDVPLRRPLEGGEHDEEQLPQAPASPEAMQHDAATRPPPPAQATVVKTERKYVGGSWCEVGDVTKKFVVTPDFERLFGSG